MSGVGEPGSPRRIGNYQLVSELGRGGMGTVFLARHEHLDRLVALKLIQRSDAAPSDLARFEVELKAMARLEHENIVRVLDGGLAAGRPYLVMERVEGETLAERLKRGGPLEERAAARLCEALARAMAYAHRQGVLHRDLKPDNVLLDATGTPRIADFGLALVLDEGAERLTRTGQLLGTPGYMSPEQADGDKQRIGERADVYSLGATLYALLCGGPPFSGGTALQVVTALLTKPPVPPGERRGSALDPGLEAICLRCLAKEPADRFASCAELAEALAAWDRAPASPEASRGRAAAAGLGLALILGLGGAMWLLTRPAPGAMAAGSKPPPTRPPAAFPATPAWYRALPGEARPPLPLPSGLSFGERPREYLNEADRSVLVWVPPGEFVMGGANDAIPPARRGLPAHKVRLTRGYFMGKYEVTLEQFKAYCAAKGLTFREVLGVRYMPAGITDRCPVMRVSWTIAQEYCAWAGARLPTEAEWEYAARGREGFIYPWGSDPPRPRAQRASLGDYAKGGKTDADGFLAVAPVGSFPRGASPFGCLDMAGNLWEWVQDRAGPYPPTPAVDPRGPERGAERVLRGGSCNDDAEWIKTTTRLMYPPDTLNGDFGFRVARSSS